MQVTVWQRLGRIFCKSSKFNPFCGKNCLLSAWGLSCVHEGT